MTFPFAIVGFDLDGTLLDTSGDLSASVNHALALSGRAALPVEQIVPMIGGGARHLLEQALAVSGGADEAEVDRLLEALLAYYKVNIAVHTRPFPHAVAALDALRTRGVKVAVVTNKRESFTHRLLLHFGLLDRFACVIGGETLGAGSAKPAPVGILAMIERCGGGRAAFVGDSIYDVRAARAAGVPVVACSFGFLHQPVDTLGADAIIDGFDELIAVLECLSATS